MKVSTSTAPKKSQFLANQVNLKAEVYSVPKVAHSQLTCTRQNSCYICVLLIKTYFLLVTRVSDYNVYESRDPSRQLSFEMSRCHDTTRLQLQLPKRWEKCPSYNMCLIGRSKEREEKFPQPHLPCYSAPTHEDRRCFHYAKDP